MIVSQHPLGSRTDWTPAASHVPWTSTEIRDVGPVGFFGWIGPTILLLKDMRKSVYENTLSEEGNRFDYELPTNASGLLRVFSREADSATKTIEVRLISARHAQTFYLGEFCIHSVVRGVNNRWFVRLHRLAVQRDDTRERYKLLEQHRSRSEMRHDVLLRAHFRDWRLVHEPESVSFSRTSELVTNGKMQSWSSNSYTCDFVLAKGLMRLCVESKHDVSGVDESCVLKCRSLRDKSLTRVLCLAGHDDALHWYDFGPPEQPHETSGRGLESLRRWQEKNNIA